MENQIEKLLKSIKAAEWLHSHLIETGATKKQIEDQHFLVCDLKEALRKEYQEKYHNFYSENSLVDTTVGNKENRLAIGVIGYAGEGSFPCLAKDLVRDNAYPVVVNDYLSKPKSLEEKAFELIDKDLYHLKINEQKHKETCSKNRKKRKARKKQKRRKKR